MTDDRDTPAGPPPEPPAPPPASPPTPPAPPVAVAPRRAGRLGWVVAALLALTLIVLVILYFMGVFDGERRREEVPWNSGYAAPAPPSTSDPATGTGLSAQPPATAPAPGGQVTEAWLLGRWGQDCPASRNPDLTFQPGGRFLLGSDAGDWLLAGNVITIRRDGHGATSSMRWDYLSQDSASVTRLRTGDVYTVHRCP